MRVRKVAAITLLVPPTQAEPRRVRPDHHTATGPDAPNILMTSFRSSWISTSSSSSSRMPTNTRPSPSPPRPMPVALDARGDIPQDILVAFYQAHGFTLLDDTPWFMSMRRDPRLIGFSIQAAPNPPPSPILKRFRPAKSLIIWRTRQDSNL